MLMYVNYPHVHHQYPFVQPNPFQVQAQPVSYQLQVPFPQPEVPCGYCPAPNAPFPSAFGAQYAQYARHIPPGIEEPAQREMSSTWQDRIDDDWPSTSEGDEFPVRGKRKRRKRKRKRNKPRPLRKKPLPPAEATLEEQPLFFGGVFGPLSIVSCPQWLCVLQDVHRRSFVSIRKQAFTADTLAQWRKTLMREVRWHKPERPPKEGKSQEPLDVLLPRSAAWLTLQGCRCEYEYAGLRFPPVAMPEWFLEITDQVTRACGLEDRPNSCNLNLYQNGADNVSWHCDDEPLFDATGRDALIVSLSLGATRSFQLRPKDDPFEETLLYLEDGDLCTMEGLCQKHYRHRVPPEEDVTEPRINLTWRWIVQHDPGCSLSNQ